MYVCIYMCMHPYLCVCVCVRVCVCVWLFEYLAARTCVRMRVCVYFAIPTPQVLKLAPLALHPPNIKKLPSPMRSRQNIPILSGNSLFIQYFGVFIIPRTDQKMNLLLISTFYYKYLKYIKYNI